MKKWSASAYAKWHAKARLRSFLKVLHDYHQTLFYRDEARIEAVDVSYETFHIQKRNGQKRQIEAPNPALRAIQSEVLKKLRGIPISPFTFGISRGALAAAPAHLDSHALLKIDIADFFNSISYEMLRDSGVLRKVRLYTGLKNLDAARLFFVDRGECAVLPQGAPTSPLLADLFMTTVDYKIARALMRMARYHGIQMQDVAYTRYVDDLIISVADSSRGSDGRRFLRHAARVVSQYVNERGLSIAEKKTSVRLVNGSRCVVVLGYSLLGRSIQVPRAIRDRARHICWKLAFGNVVSNEERGLLAYALSGRLRIPKRCIALAADRSDPDARNLLAWSKQQNISQRDRELSVISILARGSLKRMRSSETVNALVKLDILNAIRSGLLGFKPPTPPVILLGGAEVASNSYLQDFVRENGG